MKRFTQTRNHPRFQRRKTIRGGWRRRQRQEETDASGSWVRRHTSVILADRWWRKNKQEFKASLHSKAKANLSHTGPVFKTKQKRETESTEEWEHGEGMQCGRLPASPNHSRWLQNTGTNDLSWWQGCLVSSRWKGFLHNVLSLWITILLMKTGQPSEVSQNS